MEDKTLELAVGRASDWFRVHSEHRLRLFNFFIVLLLTAVAGFATATKEVLPSLQLISGVLLIVVSAVFKLLDQRTALLVKDAEMALRNVEEKISKDMGPEFRLVALAENKRGTTSYRVAFNIIYFGAVVLGVLFSVTALYQMSCFGGL